ncbi:hypothetical protein KAR91_29760 [Candidatus Pacearchaeota archaeon]|nr:hypothetical protein [Candidatus Pacearchaeota archaeon]
MKWREGLEELVVAIDLAGELQMDDLRFVANPQKFAPDDVHGVAKSIEEMGVVFGCNVDQLGKSAAFITLTGDAIVDGPMHILAGLAGGELIDGGHAIVKTTGLMDLGIRIKGGEEYQAFARIVGDTVDEGVVACQTTFSDKAPRVPKKWVGLAIETAVVNTPVQTENLNQVAVAISSGGSELIDGIIKGSAMDFAALGSHAGYIILSDAVFPRQEILCGGGGGELIVGAGDIIGPSQEFDCQIPCDARKLIYAESVGVGEAGTIINAMSLGFRQK